jgi:hypothetical protein
VTTRLRIGELLQARGLCTREQLREAWEAKVIYGDRLGTNLLALGHINEQTLAQALGAQLGVHSGYGKVIKPEPPALALVPKQVAEKRFVVPHHVVDKQLFLLMRDPYDAVAIDEVRFATSLKVVPVVVCEARIWELLARHYNFHVSMRPVPLDVPFPLRAGAGSGAGGASESTSPSSATPELTSEDDFQRLYAGMHTPAVGVFSIDDPTFTVPIETAQATSAPPVVDVHQRIQPASPRAPGPGSLDDFDDVHGAEKSQAMTSPGRPLAKLAQKDPAGSQSFLSPPRTDQGERTSWRDTIEKTNPMLALPRFEMVDGKPRLLDSDSAEAIVDLVEVDDTKTQPMLELPKRQQTLEFHVEVDELVDESPLTFAQAIEALKGAQDRNAIARVVLRAARSTFARACLLAVYPDRLVGWMGLGDGFETDRLRAIAVPRGDKSVFAFCVDSRAHYLGPLAKWPAHGNWVKATGRKIPRSVAAFPILVKGRPVNVLVVDNGHDKHVEGNDVGEVLILAQQIAKTYETLLKSA